MKITALLLLAATTAATQPPVKGTLCFGRDCRAVEGTTIAIEPNDASRQFVWTSADARSVVFGTAAAKAKEIDVAAKDLRDVTLSVRGSAARGWPAETTVALKTPPKGPEWQAVIPAKQIAKLGSLRVPRGRYSLSITAPHHVADRRALPPEGNAALREIALAPAPIVSGTVVARGEKGNVPLAGAQLFRPDGKLAGSTDEQGAFRVELSDSVPEQLVIAHAGYGTKVVPLQKQLPADANLGAIQLAAGHMLTLHVKLPESLDPKKVHLRVFGDTPGQWEMQSIVARTLSDTDVAIADLAAGSYQVVLSGSEPLERLSIDVKMGEKDEERTVTVAPFRVEGTAKVGQKPIAQGSVGFSDRTRWEAHMPIADGSFGGVMWQPGVMSAWVKANGSTLTMRSPELGTNPSTWDIVLKDRSIAGKVFDAETKQPVKAALRIQVQTGSKRSYLAGAVQPDGTYSVLTAEPGTYELRVEAPGYLNESAKFDVGENDEGARPHDFALARGVATTIEVVNSAGQPIGATGIFEGFNSDGHNPDRVYWTDGAGHATLQFRPNETRTIYVVPQDGSFAIAHVTAPRDDKPVQIVVPRAVGSIKATVKTDPAQKNQFPAMVVRYNGELLPRYVIDRRYASTGPGVIDYVSLPAGAYELWAVLLPRTSAGFAPLIGYVPKTPPVRVGVTMGEAVAEVVPQPLQ